MSALVRQIESTIPVSNDEFDDDAPRNLARVDIQTAKSRAANAGANAKRMRDVATKATKMAETWENIERQQNSLLSSLLRIN